MIAIHFVGYKQLFYHTNLNIKKKPTYFIIMNVNDRGKNQLPGMYSFLFYKILKFEMIPTMSSNIPFSLPSSTE